MLRPALMLIALRLGVSCASSSPPSSNAGQAVEVPSPASEPSVQSDTPPPARADAAPPAEREAVSEGSSMRWRLSVDSTDGGTYQFQTSGDGGVRMNGKVVQVDGGFRLRVNVSIGDVDGGP
jgi:hypothetical protein